MDIENVVKSARETVCQPLARASTLPPDFYRSPELFDLETKQVFRRNWHSVGHVAEIPNAGDFFRFDLAGEPLLIVRGKDGAVRALSAVCRHRWMLLAEGSGNSGTISCPYHKWTYALDGSLMAAPLMQEADELDRDACALPNFACEIWQGVIFVNLDSNAKSLAVSLEPLAREFAPWKMDEMEIVGRVEFEQAFNWKLLADNFMEAYHHFSIHPETIEPDYPGEETTVDASSGPFSAVRMPHRDGTPSQPLFSPLPEIPDKARRIFSVFNVFPAHIFAVLADAVVYYRLEIKAVDDFKLTIYLLAHPDSLEVPDVEVLKDFLREATRAVHIEDIAACEGVQRGMRSGTAGPARLSHLEAAIHQHQTWFLEQFAAG